MSKPKSKGQGGCHKILLWTGGGLAGLLVLFLSIVFGATYWQDGKIKGCNEGSADHCEALLGAGPVRVSEEFDPELITNEEYKPKFIERIKALKETAPSNDDALLRIYLPDFLNHFNSSPAEAD